jgi:hypothetical protein
MPAKNIYHDAVVKALQADGWTITKDPLTLKVGERNLYVDLGAERMPIGAERGTEKIAVEVQSFTSPSPVADLQQALGQFAMYRVIIAAQEPDRTLFMAVPQHVYDGILSEELGQIVLDGADLNLLVFDSAKGQVVRWIS